MLFCVIFILFQPLLYIICKFQKNLRVPGPTPPRTHAQAKIYCCAARGKGKPQIEFTPALEKLIKRFVHPIYDPAV